MFYDQIMLEMHPNTFFIVVKRDLPQLFATFSLGDVAMGEDCDLNDGGITPENWLFSRTIFMCYVDHMQDVWMIFVLHIFSGLYVEGDILLAALRPDSQSPTVVTFFAPNFAVCLHTC